MTRTDTLAPILDLIALLLRYTATTASEAADAIANDNRNLAIDALLRAALVLHRHTLTGGAA